MSSSNWMYGALLVCVSTGCVTSTPDETAQELPTNNTGGGGSQVAVDASNLPDADAGESPTQAQPSTGRGTLVEAQSSTARSSVCVSFDDAGHVAGIDEFECETAWLIHECAPDDCPWVFCGGCLLYVSELEPGSVELWARPDATTCQVFAGTYEVETDVACRVPDGERSRR